MVGASPDNTKFSYGVLRVLHETGYDMIPVNPKPGLKFEQLELPIREPDLQVYETEDGWLVELNNSTLPNIKIEKTYAKDLRDKVVQKNDRDFIQTKVSEAKWLAKAIEKRNETMLKVGTAIVERQREFLQKGAQFISPQKRHIYGKRRTLFYSLVPNFLTL